MTDREALIERGAKALFAAIENDDADRYPNTWWATGDKYRAYFRAALAVIEAEPSQSVSEAREAVVQSVLRRKHERQRGAGKGVAGMSPVPRR